MAYPAQARVGHRLNAFRLGYYIEVKAYLDARAAIGRSHASRSDYYSHLNVVISIGGVNCSHAVRYGSLRINTALNDEPDTATMTLLPNPPVVPHVGADVRIGLGTVSNLEFGGRIINIQHTRERGRNPPFLELFCTDYMPDFDQRLVTYGWPAQSASTTILDLVARFCQHNAPFTTFGVKPNMPVVAAFDVVNARPSDVLRRLTTLCAGGFYIGPARDVHAWANGPETGFADPAPLALDLITLKTFAHLEDGAQARTTVIVEGQRTTTGTGLPGDVPGWSVGIPLEDATMFRNATLPVDVRVGSQLLSVSSVCAAFNPAQTRTSKLLADVNPNPSSHYIAIQFEDPTILVGRVFGWFKIEDQYVFAESIYEGSNVAYIYGDQWGCLNAPAKAGATVTLVDFIYGISCTDGAAAPRPQPPGAEVVLVVQQASSRSQTWPPPKVEHLISDGRYSYAGAAERATQELADFDHVAMTAQWDTDDPNARIGRSQVIALEPPDPLATSLVILTSEITFPVTDRAPMRHCTGGTVKPANLLDVLVTAKD